jgi:hypothetical protein
VNGILRGFLAHGCRVERALEKLQELEREWAGLDALKRPKVTE